MVSNYYKDGRTLKRRTHIAGTQIIAFGFLGIILLGTVLLMLPIASRSHTSFGFINSLFTATTATCVTGLVVADTFSQWTVFGQIVILALIQIGGLGFMAIATLFSMAINRRIGFRERMILSEAISLSSVSGVVRMTKSIIIGTICFELTGAALLATRFIPEFGVFDGIYKSIFHSISAFCNAGIDLLGEKEPFSSITTYVKDPVINLTIAGLIIIGGLGFTVWEDLYRFRQRRRLRLHTKLVLIITTFLIISGTTLIFAFEYTNPDTLGKLNGIEKLYAAFFQSTTTRTAGFNSLDLAKMTNPSIFLMMLFMIIGGSPGSTAGGIKTTTVGILVLTAISVVRGSSKVHIFGRRISKTLILRAMAIVTISLGLLCAGITILLSVDSLPFKEAMFEVISAFGTVGLSIGITSKLSTISKITIILIMYMGRVGVMTAAMAITKRQHLYEEKISYPTETILF